MQEAARVSKSAQAWLLVLGIVLVGLAINPAVRFAQTGLAQITINHSTYTGPVAGFVIAGFLVVGIGLVVSAARHLAR